MIMSISMCVWMVQKDLFIFWYYTLYRTIYMEAETQTGCYHATAQNITVLCQTTLHRALVPVTSFPSLHSKLAWESCDMLHVLVQLMSVPTLPCGNDNWVKTNFMEQSSSTFYGIQSFINTFMKDCSLILSWTTWILSTHSHSVSWRYILVLTSHLSNISNPSVFPKCATCPTHLILLALIIRILFGEE